LRHHLRHHPSGQLRQRGRQRPRNSRGPHGGRGETRRRGRADRPALRRKVRPGDVQGLRGPPRCRRLRGERPLRAARGGDPPGRIRLPSGLLPRGDDRPDEGDGEVPQDGDEDHLQARPRGLHREGVPLRHPLAAPARALLPQCGAENHDPRRAFREVPRVPVQGRDRILCPAPEPEQERSPWQADLCGRGEGRRPGGGGPPVQRLLPGDRLRLREQHQHPRRRNASHRLPFGAHARGEPVRPEGEPGKRRERESLRRRPARRADRRGLRQSPRAPVRWADEAPSGEQRGEGDRGLPGLREAGQLLRGDAFRRQEDRGEGPRGRQGAGGGAQGEGTGKAKGGARFGGPPREAGRLPGDRPGPVRTLSSSRGTRRAARQNRPGTAGTRRSSP